MILAVAAAAALTFTATPQYASTARLFVSTSPSDTADAYQGNLFATQRVASYAEMVGRRQLGGRVADALGGDYDGDVLEGKVQAVVGPETAILDITAPTTDHEAARAQAPDQAE